MFGNILRVVCPWQPSLSQPETCVEAAARKGEPQNEGTDFETAVSLTGFGKFNFFLLLICLVGTIGHQCDITSLSFLLPSAECDLKLTAMDKGYLSAVIFVGSMCGGFVWGFLSDALGRHMLILVIYLLDSFVNIIASFSQTFWMLLICKFIAGFLICGPQSVTKAYLSEFHDQNHRAKLVLWTGLFASSGNLIVPGVAWLVIPQPWSWTLFDYITYNSWRVFILILAMPTLIAAVLISFSYETPKFLMAAGKDDKALEVLRKMYTINTGKDPDTYPVKFLTVRKMSRIEAPPVTHKSICTVIMRGFSRMKPLFKTPLLARALILFSLNFGAMFGVSTLKQWLPQLFATMAEYSHLQEAMNNTQSGGASLCEMIDFVAAVGETDQLRQAGTGHCSVAMMENSVYISTLITAIVAMIGFLTAGFIVNIMGKKTMAICTFFLGSLCAFAIYWSRSTELTLALASLFMALCGIAQIAVVSITVEVFPTILRNVALSLGLIIAQTGSMVGNITFPALLGINCIVPFILMGACALGCSALSFLLPRTKNRRNSLKLKNTTT